MRISSVSRLSSKMFSCLFRRTCAGQLRTQPKILVDEILYDNYRSHYRGKIFGVSADKVIFHFKINSGVAICCFGIYWFLYGGEHLSRLSRSSFARLSFVSGFCSCAAIGAMGLALKKWYHVPPNAVYNQAIAIVLKNERVNRVLGRFPEVGEFKAYSTLGGFKFPLPRRFRSGQYELADALGLKKRRLQMVFTLFDPTSGAEALVSCEAEKARTGFLKRANYFTAINVHLYHPQKPVEQPLVFILGDQSDTLYKGLIPSKHVQR